MSTISQFKPTLTKLETIIRQLEINLGLEHKPSPFADYIKPEIPPPKDKPAPQQQQEQQKEQTQTTKQEQKQEHKPQQEQAAQEQKQQTQDKKKKPQQQQQPQAKKASAAPTEDFGPFIDFVNIDIRVGELKKVWKHPESDKLYCEEIDIGENEVRQIASGLQTFIPIEQMTGQVLVLANLKPRKLAGFMSNGMVLCASDATHTKVELLRPAPGSKVGERVKVQNFEKLFKDEQQEVLNPKKQQWEKVAPLLKTNENLQAVWDGHLLLTTAGPIVSSTLANSNIS